MVSITTAACSQTLKRNYNTWTVVIDPELAHAPVFDTLNYQVDYQQGMIGPDGKRDTIGLRTTNVVYKNSRYNNPDIIPANCDARLKKNALTITIGYSEGGYTGEGFTITYINKKYLLEPYYWQHSVTGPDPHPPVFTYTRCNLKLDKSSYTVGDTVHGYVDFKITERHYGETINHTGRGYFRDRIKLPR